jgi:hypothetical protein
MENSRRSFLGLLAAAPVVGWLAARKPRPASLSASTTPPPVYGFDERLTLTQAACDAEVNFVAAENLRRGSFVAITGAMIGDSFGVKTASVNDRPCGVMLKSVAAGQDVGDHVLVQGVCSVSLCE